MKILKYWQRAEKQVLTPEQESVLVALWRGSDISLDDARRAAEAAVRRVAERIGIEGWPMRPYPYPERALREEVLEELAGATRAVVTRNAYGAEVLCAERLLMADLDAPRETGGWLGRLFGKPSAREAAVQPFRDRIAAFLSRQPFGSFRLYETAAGFRALRTDARMDPESAEAQQLLEALGSDPTYVKLCRGQACFRAR